MSIFHLSRINKYIFYKHLQAYSLMTGDCVVSTSPESFKYFQNTSKVSLITISYQLERKLKSIF